MSDASVSESVRALITLRNIGEISARKLIAVGIRSPDQIAAMGAVEVFLRLRESYPVNIAMLWALQGGLLDLPWHDLPEDIKAALLGELAAAGNRPDAERKPEL